MKCPNCGFEINEEAYECPKCGIVFAKWEEFQAKKEEGLITPPPWYKRRISPTARIFRAGAGLVAVGLGIMFLLEGRLLSSFWTYMIMAFYLFLGLYLLITTMERVSVGRFAIETGTIMLISLGLILSFPEVLSSNEPKQKKLPEIPHEAVVYLKTSLQCTQRLVTLLGKKKISKKEALQETKKLNLDKLSRLYKALPGDLKQKLSKVYRLQKNLTPLIDQINKWLVQKAPDGPAVWMPEEVRRNFKAQIIGLKQEIQRSLILLRRQYSIKLN